MSKLHYLIALYVTHSLYLNSFSSLSIFTPPLSLFLITSSFYKLFKLFTAGSSFGSSKLHVSEGILSKKYSENYKNIFSSSMSR